MEIIEILFKIASRFFQFFSHVAVATRIRKKYQIHDAIIWKKVPRDTIATENRARSRNRVMSSFERFQMFKLV